jgi:hypothetical protein
MTDQAEIPDAALKRAAATGGQSALLDREHSEGMADRAWISGHSHQERR